MASRQPVTQLATHEVTNQPPALENYDLYDLDRPLVEAVERNSAPWASDRLHTFGQVCGSEEMLENGRLANKFPPELKTHDRYGHRIDEVEYHPAYHAVMREGVAHAIHSIAWTSEGPGGHSVFTALDYLLVQVEAGATCPLSMTYAATPTLRQQPDIAENWLPGIMSLSYDPRCLPMTEKSGLTIGMAMTEKQGGSDVRANSTTASPLDQPGRKGGKPFTRGHIYKLLSNPVYVGEIVHKGERHAGEHEGIIDRKTWDAVQEQLSRNAVVRHRDSNIKADPANSRRKVIAMSTSL